MNEAAIRSFAKFRNAGVRQNGRSRMVKRSDIRFSHLQVLLERLGF